MALITNPLLPTNTLEAVNVALGYMREPPIDDLALVNTSWAVETCYRALMTSSRRFQSRGWTFNQYNRTYTPVAGAITLPTNIVAAKPPEDMTRYGTAIPMLRGSGKVMDSVTGSYTVWGTAPITFTVTELIDFEDMPECAKVIVTLTAAGIVGEATGEGMEMAPFHQRAFTEAQADLLEYELEAMPVNFLSTLDLRRSS